MKTLCAWVMCAAALALGGCGEPASPAAASADSGGDAAVDASADAGGDGGADASADTLGDASADAAADTAADTAADSGADAMADSGADTAADTAADGGSDASADASADASPDGADASAAVACGGSPVVFPVFTKTCGQDSDCVAVLHQVNCCGTLGAFGLHVSQGAAFAAAEAQCQAQYPDCKCAQQPTMGEDGYTTSDGGFKAVCDAGVCRAVVPQPKAECGSGGLVWPKPVKTCLVNADCTYAMKTVDCCGSQQATGITKAAKPSFEAAEVKCAATMAICDCMPKPVVHDDGSSAGDGMTAVKCDGGLCSTYAK